MPAEWEPHRATWLVWPHNRADWDVKTSAVEWCFCETRTPPDLRRAGGDHLPERSGRPAGGVAPGTLRRRSLRGRPAGGGDESLLDPGHRTDLRLPADGRRPGRDCRDRLALHRVGPLPGLRPGRQPAAAPLPPPGRAPLRPHRADRRTPAPNGPRGRQHRRQRRGAAADHGGVPPRARPEAKSRRGAPRPGGQPPQPPRRPTRPLAGGGHRRRRHPRPRRRRGPLRRPRHRRSGPGAGQPRT